MSEILRTPKKSELEGSDGFTPLQVPGGRPHSAKDLFRLELNKEQQKAMKLGLPFAEATAQFDFDQIAAQKELTLKNQGHLAGFKAPKTDWAKYSDLKNFELLEEKIVRDKEMSKEHKVAVNVRYKKYKYNGFSNTYAVMEDGNDALTRALDVLTDRKPRQLEHPNSNKNEKGKPAKKD